MRTYFGWRSQHFRSPEIIILRCNSLYHLYVCMYVCMYIYIYLCMYVCMYVCMSLTSSRSSNFLRFLSMWNFSMVLKIFGGDLTVTELWLCPGLASIVCMYVCMYVCMSIWKKTQIHINIHVHSFICIHTYIHTVHINIQKNNK